MLKGESVCHATAGPWEEEQLEHPPTYWMGGEEGLKDDARDKERRSLFGGAEL